MLLMIDNYDSFTYNLVQYFGELGQDVLVKRNDETSVEEIEALKPEYIVISPGPCTPKEAGISNDVIRTFSGKTPILGVCLGHQCMTEVFGGRVVRANLVMHGKTSQVAHNNTGVFTGLPSPLTVTRYHSLTAQPDVLPEGFSVTAWTDEPQGRVIMGLKHNTLPIEGVQFHPESFMTEYGHDMLKNFLQGS